ncbi:MAG: hypothetical protein NZ482_10065, partial [Gloeomargarita sp. SKYG98]|nr:hypothetical protein [Gloeomargarita sp. SKYG98]
MAYRDGEYSLTKLYWVVRKLACLDWSDARIRSVRPYCWRRPGVVRRGGEYWTASRQVASDYLAALTGHIRDHLPHHTGAELAESFGLLYRQQYACSPLTLPRLLRVCQELARWYAQSWLPGDGLVCRIETSREAPAWLVRLLQFLHNHERHELDYREVCRHLPALPASRAQGVDGGVVVGAGVSGASEPPGLPGGELLAAVGPGGDARLGDRPGLGRGRVASVGQGPGDGAAAQRQAS